MTRTGVSWRVTLIVGLIGGTCSAQNGNVIFPGSTPEGDFLRGEGFFLIGAGTFNLMSAQAGAINTDSWMRLNEYLYQSRKNQERVWNEKIQARMRVRNQALADIRRRQEEQPNEADLIGANSLNLLVEKLSDPKIHPSTLRYSRVALPGGSLQAIPFHHPTSGALFSLRRLKVADSWPTVLLKAEFDPERRAYLRAVDTILEQDVNGTLTQDALDDLVNRCENLMVKLERTIPQSDLKVFLSGRLFIDDLTKLANSLRTDNFLQRMLAEIERFPGTTVAELVEFMWRYNLQFFPAETPAERDLYKILYQSLSKQRDLVLSRGPAPDEELKGDPIPIGGPAAGRP